MLSLLVNAKYSPIDCMDDRYQGKGDVIHEFIYTGYDPVEFKRSRRLQKRCGISCYSFPFYLNRCEPACPRVVAMISLHDDFFIVNIGWLKMMLQM